MAEIQSAGGNGDESTRGNRPDLTDRQVHRRGIYRLRPISAANSGGGRRNRARQQWGDAIARAQAREEEEVSEESDRVGLTGPPGRVQPGRPAPIGGPGSTGGPG
jgi:hypothetical protein